MTQDPYSSPQTDFNYSSQLPNPKASLAMPLVENSFWLRLLGIALILNGALACLTIVGIIFGWLPIWIGILLFQAAAAYDRLKTNNNPQLEYDAHSKLALALKIQGIMVLIGLILFALYVCFIILMLVLGVSGMFLA